MRIPRILHRIWLRDEMPEAFAAFGERWRELHPDWLWQEWTDPSELEHLPGAQIRARAQEYFPDDWKRFEADVLRLELLWLHGGVYVDTDIEPHAAIDELFEEEPDVADMNELEVLMALSPQQVRQIHPVTNCFMAAIPFHPYIGELISELETALSRTPRRSLAQTIGPWHLTRTLRARPWRGVHVLHWSSLFGERGEGSRWLTHHWNNAKRKRGEGLG